MEDVRSQIRGAPSAESLAWAEACIGSGARSESFMILSGGSACAIHALDVVDRGGARHPLVLKRFFREDWLSREPDVAAREARHLEALADVALPIPRLVGVDPTGAHCDHPAVLMTRLPGRAVLEPLDREAWLRAQVEPLLVLHALPDAVASGFGAYRSYNDPRALSPPSWTRDEAVWERVLARVCGEVPEYRPGFVHRDYHPTNLLFCQGQLSAVLDFTDSSFGPAAADLGHCRLNLAQLCGAGVAERFLEIHEELAPGAIEGDPYWDLLSLVEILPGPEDVYWGWTNLGVRGLSTRLVRERLDDYAARLVAKLGSR